MAHLESAKSVYFPKYITICASVFAFLILMTIEYGSLQAVEPITNPSSPPTANKINDQFVGAVLQGQLDALPALLKAGADVNAPVSANMIPSSLSD